jgi:hypothetical protein
MRDEKLKIKKNTKLAISAFLEPFSNPYFLMNHIQEDFSIPLMASALLDLTFFNLKILELWKLHFLPAPVNLAELLSWL